MSFTFSCGSDFICNPDRIAIHISITAHHYIHVSLTLHLVNVNTMLPIPAFTAPRALVLRKPRRTATCTRRLRSSVWTSCAESTQIPNTPSLLLRNWAESRKIASTIDLSRRFVSILFLSNQCHRAAFAEKQLMKWAEKYTISRRLLILSAGMQATPGAFLPWPIVTAAEQRDIDLTEERPCASFDISDCEFFYNFKQTVTVAMPWRALLKN